MMTNLIDSHSHLNDEKLINDIDNVLLNMKEYNVDRVLIPGYNLSSSLDALKLAKTHEEFYAAVGIHPENIHEDTISVLGEIEKLLNNERVIAVGEVGLDYHYRDDDKEMQKEYFKRQLDLAFDYNLPVIIHMRDSTSDTLSVIKEHINNRGKRENIGIMHSFSGSVETMNEFLKLGFYISFSGPVTFKNARVNKECAIMCPLDRILVETDAPYLTPEPFRGKRNEPAYVFYTLEEIAKLKGIKSADLAYNIRCNFHRLFNIRGEEEWV